MLLDADQAIAVPLSRGEVRARPGESKQPGVRGGQLTIARAAQLAVLVAALAWAFAPFVLVALDAARHHRVFLGVAGYYPMDGLQYLAWVRDAHHGLIRNLFGPVGGAVFVHPMWSLSGLVQAATNASPTGLVAFWKALSALVLVGGCARLVARHIRREHGPRRTVALVLAVFGGLTPLAALLLVIDRGAAGGDFARAVGDLVPAMSLWDYSPLAIALGLMPLAIEGAERLLAGARDRCTTIGTAAAGLTVAWLHPWQGEILIIVFAGLVAWRAADGPRPQRARRRLWPANVRRSCSPSLALAAICTLAPIAYYFVLSRADAGWRVSERTSAYLALIPFPVLVCCVLPLVAVGVLAARRSIGDPASRPLLLWAAATIVAVAVSRSGQYRAIDGLAIPLAVLAVRAWPRDRSSIVRRLAAVAPLLAVLAPLGVFAFAAARHLGSAQVSAYTELDRSDVRAVRLAASYARGGPILSTAALGTAIPALTGNASWVGHPIWTPQPGIRREQSELLFAGGSTPAQARSLIRSARSNALVEPCGWHGRLERDLSPLGFREVRVGCARVYAR